METPPRNFHHFIDTLRRRVQSLEYTNALIKVWGEILKGSPPPVVTSPPSPAPSIEKIAMRPAALPTATLIRGSVGERAMR